MHVLTRLTKRSLRPCDGITAFGQALLRKTFAACIQQRSCRFLKDIR
jgi:hypothetical protein